MTENINVGNGDFVTMARIVNGNTQVLDNGLKKLTDGCLKAFNIVDDNIDMLEKRLDRHTKALKYASKGLRWAGLGLLCCNFGMFLVDRKVQKLEKRVKELEDKQVVDDFMKDEDLDCLK